ncbi:MAG: hypothetical protein GVY05_12045 [Bacteroidetes bacterium]|jgi:hypothetical protein|nr:hypothetical protein [Bacteroidota bacterium]
MKRQYKILLLLVLILATAKVKAQIPGFGDNVDDEPQAVINFLIPVALTIGAYFGI